MRNMTAENTALAVFAVMAIVLLLWFIKPQQKYIYPLVRSGVQAKLDYQTKNMQVFESEHYRIKYDAVDEAYVLMVAKAAEAAYQPVIDTLGFSVDGKKTLIIMYHDKRMMNKLTGQLGTEGAMGVYWGGVIQVLSPQIWMNTADLDNFEKKGPLLHEYTHLAFDYMTSGNYSRWFTEGLAQYMEYKMYNYEWLSANNNLNSELYSMKQLDESFDTLPNQAMAYRESFAAVRFIAEVYGEDKLREIIGYLNKGERQDRAIERAIKMSYDEFSKTWPLWARENMKR